MRGPNISDRISSGGPVFFFIKIGPGRPILGGGGGGIKIFVTHGMDDGAGLPHFPHVVLLFSKNCSFQCNYILSVCCVL